MMPRTDLRHFGLRQLCVLALVAGVVFIGPLRASAAVRGAATLVVTSTSLPVATTGIEYTATLSVSGGTAPYIWSLLTGPVPTGLVLNSSGMLVGIPGPVGTFSLALRVTDASGLTTTATLSLVVRTPPPTPQSIVTATSLGIVTTMGTAYATPVVTHVLSTPIVGVASSPKGIGSWVVTEDGQVQIVGNVLSYGSVPPRRAKNKVVGIASDESGTGYWIATSTGKVYGFGDAKSRGSISQSDLRGHVVAIAAAVRGNGYYLVTTTGKVYGFGTARVVGSVAARRQHVQIAGITTTPTGTGYWIATTTGAVYRFGAARKLRVPGPPSTGTIVAIATATTGIGYYLVSATGTVYSYGSALPVSPPSLAPAGQVVGVSTAV